MEGLAAVAGVILALWAAARLLGALARLVEALVLGALSVWLVTGKLPSSPDVLSEAWSRLLTVLDEIWWKIALMLSRAVPR